MRVLPSRLVAAALLAGVGCSPKLDAFTSPTGQYSVKMPVPPDKVTTQTQTVDTEYGPIPVTVHAVGILNLPVKHFMTFHLPLPGGPFANWSDQQILEFFLREVLAELGCVPGRLDNLLSEKHAPVEAPFEGSYEKETLHGRARIYLIKGRLILVLYAGPERSAREHAAGREFLKSFTYLGPS